MDGRTGDPRIPGGGRGRGAGSNPPNRFEKIELVPDPDFVDDDPALPTTEFFRDASRSILTTNDSPDVPFEVSANPYRGCEHGCVYCYARPTHEYFGLSAGLDFETKIFVKGDAPELLRRELASPKWTPRPVAISGVTDPYQPIERRLQLTRRCLEVLAEFRNPVEIITKNRLVARDADVLAALARDHAAAVHVSVTTLDDDLVGSLEPRTSRPKQRLAAIEELSRAGIPVGVLIAPVIPGLTDHEIPAILEACAKAGAGFAGFVVLRLPHAVRPLFEEWLERHAPLRAKKVLNRIRSLRGGKLNDPRFGSRMRGEGVFAEEIASLFKIACRKAGLGKRGPELSTAAFRRPSGGQLSLFESR